MCFYSSLCICKMCLQPVRLKYCKKFSVALKLQNTNWFDGFFFLPFRSQWSPLFYLVAVHHVNSFVFQRVDPEVSLALPSFLRNHRSHITYHRSNITDYIYRNHIHPTSFPKIKRGGPGNQVGFWHTLPRHQCRSKGNISGGGGGTRAPEARAARGVWGHAPPENFEI